MNKQQQNMASEDLLYATILIVISIIGAEEFLVLRVISGILGVFWLTARIYQLYNHHEY